MENSNKATVSSGFTSTINPKLTYAKAGDKVLIIADHGNVKIVENASGQRFAVHESYLEVK